MSRSAPDGLHVVGNQDLGLPLLTFVVGVTGLALLSLLTIVLPLLAAILVTQRLFGRRRPPNGRWRASIYFFFLVIAGALVFAQSVIGLSLFMG